MPRSSARTLCVLTGVLCLLAACQDEAARLQEHMERGMEYAEAGQHDEAIIEFKSAQQLDPNHAPAHFELAKSYFATSQLSDGFWELRETVRLDPSNIEAKIEFSRVALLANEEEEAIAHMDEILAEDPTNVTAHLVRGQGLDRLGRFEESRAAYIAANRADPEDQGALRALARSQVRENDDAAALATYAKLVDLHPTFINYSLAARFAPRIEEDKEEGLARRERYMRKAIEVADGDERPRAYAQMAAFLVGQERKQEAFDLLRKGTETEEDKAEYFFLLAGLHRTEGELEEADAMLQRASEARPDDPGVLLGLAQYRVERNDLDGALEATNRALEVDPEYRQGRIHKAEVLLKKSARDRDKQARQEAREILDEVLAEEPGDPVALVADALYQITEREFDRAVDQVRTALQKRPDWAQAYFVLGLALSGQHDYAAARVELARALDLAPGLTRARELLARVHHQLGEPEYVIERAREVLRSDPEDRAMQLLLAQNLVLQGDIEGAEESLAGIPEEERDGEVLYALGRLQQAQGNFEKAHEYLVRANKELPSNWDTLQALLELDRLQGQVGRSAPLVKGAVASSPNDPRLHQLAAVVAFNEKRFEDSEASFRKAIEVAPTDVSSYQRMARFLLAQGRMDEAVETYETARDKNPEAAMLHHFLGVLYEIKGEPDRAIESYQNAIRFGEQLSDAKLGEAKNNLAYLYTVEGRSLEEALDLAQDAKALLPNNASVADTLGWVLFKRGVHSAAVTYLKEAEAATREGDASLGVVRMHLAQAHEANGEPEEALAAAERSLEALESLRKAREERGIEPGPEPDWAEEARALRDRVAAKTASR